MHNATSKVFVVVALAAVPVVAVGCSSSSPSQSDKSAKSSALAQAAPTGDSTGSAATVASAQSLASDIKAKIVQAFPNAANISVSCPNALPKQTGSTETCLITEASGTTVNVTVTATNSSGGYHFQVANQPN